MINILKHRDENLVRLYKYFLPYKGKIAVASIFLIATAYFGIKLRYNLVRFIVNHISPAF